MAVKDRSNYPAGFGRGILLQELPIAPAHRKIYYVGNHSTVVKGEIGKSDSNDGSYYRPFSTVDYAVSQMKSGDIMYIRPEHTETIAAADAIDFDVAGISIIGLGNGSDRPRFDYTDAAGEIAIGADNIYIENINFHANVDSVAIAIDIEDGVDFAHIRNCYFDVETAGTDEFDNAIRLTNNNTGCLIENCEIDMGIADAVRAIFLDADTQGLIIRNNIIRGDYSTACIGGDTTLSTDLLIDNNLLIQGEAGDINAVAAISLLTGSHGVIQNNHIVANLATPDLSVVADTCFMFNNLYSETITGAAEPLYVDKVPDDANNFIGVDDANNAAATTNVVANRDGSILERLEHLNNKDAQGEKFFVQKSLTSSAILTTGVDVTGTASGGDIYIENVLIETDGTGLAGGTLFTIEKDAGSGVLTFFTEAVADLGANKSEDMSAMDTANIPVVLDSGQKLVAKCTVGNCTGAGVVDITLVCYRLADAAPLAAA